MLSAILFFALISYNCVSGAMMNGTVDSDEPMTPFNPDNAPDLVLGEKKNSSVSEDEDEGDETDRRFFITEKPFDEWEVKGLPPGAEWTLMPDRADDYIVYPQKDSGQGEREYDGAFWFYLVVAIIGTIGLLVFGAFLAFDVAKRGQKQSEDREKYIGKKLGELDHVGMGKPAKKPLSTQTSGKSPVKTSSIKTSSAKTSQSAQTVRSSTLGSKSDIKDGKAESKTEPKRSKPKIPSNKDEVSKKTLSAGV